MIFCLSIGTPVWSWIDCFTAATPAAAENGTV
jgi:hypothetical protein